MMTPLEKFSWLVRGFPEPLDCIDWAALHSLMAANLSKPKYREVQPTDLKAGDVVCVPKAVGSHHLEGVFKRIQVLEGGNRALINGWSFPLNGRYKFYLRLN